MSIGNVELLQCFATAASATFLVTNKHLSFLPVSASTNDTTANPLSVPLSSSAATTYSSEIWLKWRMNILPDFDITNFKVYGSNTQPDSPLNDSVFIYLGATTLASTPTLSPSLVATRQQHANYYDSTNSLLIPLNPGDNKLDAINELTEYCVVQLHVTFGASSGYSGALPFSISYEET